MKYYGQQGEDYIMWSLFPSKTDGFFVDIGAFDGMQYSNTYSFEQAGWNGICAEPHPTYFPMLQKNRPNSINVECAISDTDMTKATFYLSDCGPLSSLDNSLENRFKKKFKKIFNGYKTQQVAVRTINSLLEEHRIDRVDLVSLDIEGTEIDALNGFDIEKYLPRVVIVEAIDKSRLDKIVEYMSGHGYRLARGKFGNYIFCASVEDCETIKNVNVSLVRKNLVHTRHPVKVFR